MTMDVLKPAHPNGIGVLGMVSGGWVSDMNSVADAGLANPFTKRGQTVFLIGHGSQPKFTIGEIIPQIQRAVRFM